jgi:hypothetical protein
MLDRVGDALKDRKVSFVRLDGSMTATVRTAPSASPFLPCALFADLCFFIIFFFLMRFRSGAQKSHHFVSRGSDGQSVLDLAQSRHVSCLLTYSTAFSVL